MAYLGNTPNRANTVLQLEGRKSFSFALWLKEPNGAHIDLTGCLIDFVMKSSPYDTNDTADEDNLITNSRAVIVDPVTGYARFNFQASDLSATSGEYDYSIVLTTPEGYSVVIVKGVVELLPNTEFAAGLENYPAAEPTVFLDVVLRGLNVVEVYVGSVLPPGWGYLANGDKARLDQLVNIILEAPAFGSAAYKNAEYFALAEAAIPPGGFTGRVLGKRTNADYDIDWINIPDGEGGAGLDATGVPAGYVPTAKAPDAWDWAPAIANADDLTDGLVNVVMTAAERSKLGGVAPGAEVNMNVNADWNAASGDAEILNKPAVALAGHTHVLADITNLTRGTPIPTGGSTGALYIRRRV